MALPERLMPLPMAQAFVVCREIFEDCRSHDVILVAPFSGLTLPAYPGPLRLSVYAHLTGGHGVYQMALELRDGDDQVAWRWQAPVPLRYDEPLRSHRLVLYDAILHIPGPGRYDLVLLANGEDLAHHALEVHAAGARG